jgi:kelch-like protein 10
MFSLSDNAAKVYYDLLAMYQNGEFCDATLRTDDGGIFSVHRIVLVGDSEYFRALFTTTLHVEQLSDVKISNISTETLRMMLDYMYSRTITISDSNVCKILESADYLGIVRLKTACCEFIEKQIDGSNCLGIRSFAKSMFCPALFETTQNYLMRNFVEISQISDELLELDLDDVLSIFGDDKLNVKNEEMVWEAALRWIKHKEEIRKPKIVELLSQIRTGLMETQYFMEHVKDHPYVHGNEGCRPIVIETLRFLYDLEVITERDGEIPTPSIARPRIPHEVLFAIGGWSGGSPTSFIETYDTRADRWIRVEEVDSPRAYHGTIALGFDIVIVGGFDGVDYFNSCRAFNAVKKTWRDLAPMHSRRCYVSVALLDKYIYAMGGYDGHHRQNTAERYDPATNQWTMIAPMNAQRSDACATALKGKIYITGGFNGTECLSSAEVYDPETNQWTVIAPMRNRRSGVSCIAYHNSVYVVGGFNGISRMCSGEKYNPASNTWTSIPDMYNPRSNFAIEVIDDMIFCIGGFNGVTTIYHVECFDERTNEWYEATDMNIYRSALSACVIMGLPNIYDYIHQHRERLMEEKRQRLLVLQQQQRT